MDKKQFWERTTRDMNEALTRHKVPASIGDHSEASFEEVDMGELCELVHELEIRLGEGVLSSRQVFGLGCLRRSGL